MFLDTEPLQKPLETPVDSADLEQKLSEAETRNTELAAELTALQGELTGEIARLQEELTGEKEEVAQLQEELRTKSDGDEVKKLETALRKEKEKFREMSCRQAAEQEDLPAEDREIEELKQKLAGSGRSSRTHLSHSDSDDDPLLVSTQASHKPPVRRGKAPPIDQYTGEDPEIRFDNWLPALQRAAHWNGWTDEETLLQLAGHLRGKALQEWNLLVESDKATFQKAIAALREVLGPGSKVLAAQDFRHTTQNEGESVSNFIRRLERVFSIAYGTKR